MGGKRRRTAEEGERKAGGGGGRAQRTGDRVVGSQGSGCMWEQLAVAVYELRRPVRSYDTILANRRVLVPLPPGRPAPSPAPYRCFFHPTMASSRLRPAPPCHAASRVGSEPHRRVRTVMWGGVDVVPSRQRSRSTALCASSGHLASIPFGLADVSCRTPQINGCPPAHVGEPKQARTVSRPIPAADLHPRQHTP